jgi:hypothetical protein
MKKAFSLFSIIAMAGLCLMFTSCTRDEDTEIAMDVSGQWQGNWGMYYEYTWIENGIEYTRAYDSYDTDIIFYPNRDYATHGYGYQVDWYTEGPYQRLSHRFDWEVFNGRIILKYPRDPDGSDYSTTISNYRLNSNRFTGYFPNSTEPFYLNKIQDYYNWWEYENLYRSHHYVYLEWDWDGFYYDLYDPFYYAKTRSAEATDSVGKPAEGRITKIGSRLSEK